MSEPQWGRRPDAGRWMRRVPAGTVSAVLLSSVTLYLAAEYRYRYVWTADQRTYLKSYVQSTAASSLNLRPKPYAIPMADSRPGVIYNNADVASYLKSAVFGGQSLLALARQPFLAAGLVLSLGLVWGIPYDAAKRRQRRHGKRLKGPMLVSAVDFVFTPPADGIAIAQERGPAIRIPRGLEAHHLVTVGDTGTGKSSLIRQILCQVRDRGETAVVYDPAREFLPQFYDEARGDLVLNPLDARCPYWAPGDEIRRDAEALTLAASLFQPQPGEKGFFTLSSQQIFAHLLQQRPSAEQLVSWLSNEDDLDRLLARTPHASKLAKDAPAQRHGVLASLNMQAITLQLLPREAETTSRWSAAAWSRHRTGWLFFTSGPETRERQIPLMTLWLDLLILRLMEGRPGPKTWLVIDELASLRKLPQLQTAMTESRRANTPMVIGFQARSQMEALYGPAWEGILSQPATKIILRTSEANSAEWLSKTIGQVEIERMRESRSSGGRDSRSFGLERSVEPLILPSEIEGLADRTGFLKVGNMVTPLTFPYVTLPDIAHGFIERETRAVATALRPPASAAAHGHAQYID